MSDTISFEELSTHNQGNYTLDGITNNNPTPGIPQVSASSGPGGSNYTFGLTGSVCGAAGKLETTNTSLKLTTDIVELQRFAGNCFSFLQGDKAEEVAGTQDTKADVVHTSAAETSGVSGNPADIQNGTAREANEQKQKLDAMRSGFNDNRNDPSIFGILKEFVELPVDLLKAVIPANREQTTDSINTGESEGKNLFTDIYSDIAKEVKNFTKAYTSMASEAAIKQAKVVLNAKKERAKVMQEKIKEIKDDNILKRLSKNIGSLFSGPSVENAEKNLKSTLDKDAVAKEAGDIAAKQARKK